MSRAMRRCSPGWRAGHRAGRRWSRSMARTGCGSTSAGWRICSAARRGWCAISRRGSRRMGLTVPRGAGRDDAARRGGWRAIPRPALLPRERAELSDLLAPLPVAALRLPPGPTRTLELLGLKTIGAARRGAAAEPGAALSRGRQSAGRARPDARAQGRTADRGAVRSAAARHDPAGRAGRRSRARRGRRSTCWCPNWSRCWRRGGWGCGGWCCAAIASMARWRWRRRRPRCRAARRSICAACWSTRPTSSTPASGSTPSCSRRAGASRWARRRTAWSRNRAASARWPNWSTG